MSSSFDSFTHIDTTTGMPAMVDIGNKQVTRRTATAQSIVVLNAEIMKHLSGNDIETRKGPVFQTAIIAGTMAAKKTAELIPLCHPLALEDCKIIIEAKDQHEVLVNCTVSITAKTGVEMEALTGASVAALTIYDMCKVFSHEIIIKETKLVAKSGGKSDFLSNETAPLLNGLVLAGGKSRRMKTDKGSLVYHKKTQQEYLIDLLSGFCDTVYLSCNSDQAKMLNDRYNVIEDSFLNIGPTGGILSAFRNDAAVVWLTVACDLPFLSEKSVSYLIANRNAGKDATCFFDPSGKLPEPLITIWEPKSYPLLLHFLSKNITCPRKVLMNMDIELLQAPDINELTNVNTEMDHKAAVEKLNLLKS